MRAWIFSFVEVDDVQIKLRAQIGGSEEVVVDNGMHMGYV